MAKGPKVNPAPTLSLKDFGRDKNDIAKRPGSTIVKTCPSGDYDRDNYCGI